MPRLASAGPFAIVATDLDGTLLRSDLTVSYRTRNALELARASGARHLVVTGRQAATLRPLLNTFGYRGVAVCGQGTQIYDMDGHRLVWSTTLDRAVARAVVALVTAQVGRVFVAVATAGLDGRLLVTPGFSSATNDECELVDPARLWAEPIEKLLLRHPALSAAALGAEILRVCGEAVTVTHSQASFIEVLPSGVTKAYGLARVAEHLGFDPLETIAFGDMPNDIPMLEWAGYAVAMRNGDTSVHAVAHEIGPSNDEDGVATILERVFATTEG